MRLCVPFGGYLEFEARGGRSFLLLEREVPQGFNEAVILKDGETPVGIVFRVRDPSHRNRGVPVGVVVGREWHVRRSDVPRALIRYAGPVAASLGGPAPLAGRLGRRGA